MPGNMTFDHLKQAVDSLPYRGRRILSPWTSTTESSDTARKGAN